MSDYSKHTNDDRIRIGFTLPARKVIDTFMGARAEIFEISEPGIRLFRDVKMVKSEVTGIWTWGPSIRIYTILLQSTTLIDQDR